MSTAANTIVEKLSTFVVPQTQRPLGTSGTRVSVDAMSSGLRVSVHCGFPVERSRADLIERLRAHCAPDQGIEFTVDWSVEMHSVQQGLKPLPGVRNLIAVASAKGGVGKSTVAANLALGLVQEGARVGILDADIYGPSQPRILGLLGRRPESPDGKTITPLPAHGAVAMSIGFLVDEKQPMAWRGPMVTSALNQLLMHTTWGELDYLVVDMPPGTGDIQLTLAQKVPVSGAVIVTTPQEVALADTRKGLEMFQKVAVPILGVVENMGVHVCTQCGHAESIFGIEGGARLAAHYGVPLLGSLPLETRVREQTDAGVPTVVADPESAAGRRFIEVAGRVAGELAATAKDYSHLFPKITVEES
jgi:ATP-binding protein involved in chromosome partitioning